jgi:hypothetical protein
MASSAAPVPPKRPQDAKKEASEILLQNMFDRMPSPSTPLERTADFRDEVTGVEQKCKAIIHNFDTSINYLLSLS